MPTYMPGPNDSGLATPLEVDILDTLCTTCRKKFEVPDVPVASFKQWLKDGRPADLSTYLPDHTELQRQAIAKHTCPDCLSVQ